jgi:hypothetical protein
MLGRLLGMAARTAPPADGSAPRKRVRPGGSLLSDAVGPSAVA